MLPHYLFTYFNDEISCWWVLHPGKGKKKKNNPKKSLHFDTLLSKKPLALWWLPQKDSAIRKNRKLNSQDNTLEVQMERFCSDIMLQPRVQDQVFILPRCP